MAGKRQVVVPGGIRKVIQTGGSTASPGTTIAELGSATVSLAQLKTLLGITAPAAGSSGSSGGSTASILAGAGLLGGGSVIGAVPLYLAQSTPPVVWNDALLPDDFVGGAASGGGGGGGTASPLTTKGDLYTYGTSNTRLPVGSNGQVVTADSTQTLGVKWATPATGLVYGNTTIPAGNTVANTTVETAFTSSYTIPANAMAAGTVIRIRAFGLASTTTGTQNIQMRLKFGSTIMLDTGVIAPLSASSVNDGWFFEGQLIVQSAGTTGTVESQGVARFETGPSSTAVITIENTAPITIDTTSAQVITITADWGTANPSNSIQLRELVVWLENPGIPFTVASTTNITPDTHPASPTAWDDEFEAVSLDPKWTWVNQNGNTATLSAGSAIITTTNGTIDSISAIVQSISGTFDVAAKIGSAAYNTDARHGMYVGLGGTGKLYMLGWFINAGSPEFYVNSYPSPTGATNTSFTSGSGSAPFASIAGRPFYYYRIKYDGTNIVFYVSLTGVFWNQLTSVTVASYLGSAPTSIGLSTSSNGITVTAGLPSIVDWFRRLA